MGLVGTVLWPGVATAHAVLLRGTPAPGATLPPGHVPIDLQFNSRVEHAASQLQLQSGESAPRKLPLVDSPVDVLRAEADLAPGAYTLRWQVLAVDGHLTRGSIPFTVTKAPGPSPAGSAAQ